MTTGNSAGYDLNILGLAISVGNLDRAVAWWQRVFGFEVVSRTRVEAVNASAAIVRGAGFQMELLEAPGRHRIDELFAEPPAHLLPIGNKALVLRTSDIAAVTRDLEAKGVTFVWKELDLGIGVGTAIRDSEDNLVSILQPIGAHPPGPSAGSGKRGEQHR
jgi:catechol 2,3-dioxygenase-like lactoylglutathione lyase family enzyme